MSEQLESSLNDFHKVHGETKQISKTHFLERFLVAEVVAINDSEILLTSHDGVIKAQMSFSCVLTPEIGDQVLWAPTAIGSFVMSILTRKTTAQAEMNFKNGVRISTSTGDLQLSSANDLSIHALAQAKVFARELDASTLKANLYAEDATVHGVQLNLVFQKIHQVCDTFTKMAKTAFYAFDTCVKKVKDVDKIQAGQMHHEAEQVMATRGEHMLVSAKQDIKMNAERVHMG